MSGGEIGLLSFCCLGYCHAKYLSDAIGSIRKVEYDLIEVIVVDDGSKDDSVSMLNAIAASVPFKMTVLAQENTGNIGLNFNRALQLAKGEFVAFLSLDDIYNPAVILSHIKSMVADPSLAFIASSKTVSVNDEGFVTEKAGQLKLSGSDISGISDLLELEYSEFGSFFIQSAIFRKEIVDAVGGFDEDMTGDDIVLRTKIFRYLDEHRRYSFKVLGNNSFFYRLHANNVHRDFPRQFKTVTQYLSRYWPDRESPSILVGWICSYVKDHQFEDYISIFGVNERASLLLMHSDVKKAIIQSLREEFGVVGMLSNKLYKRVKLGSDVRCVTLFGFIKIKYKRVTKKQRLMRHYSSY
tara:strand:- start:593 stop:1654 length:1062 start_codon:yes stop_codon:yes gene_type:complete